MFFEWEFYKYVDSFLGRTIACPPVPREGQTQVQLDNGAIYTFA